MGGSSSSSVSMLLLFLVSLSSPSLYLNVVHSSYSCVQQQHQLLCHDSERSALLQFRQSFLIDCASFYHPSAYPKAATWDSSGDCCSWDGVECDGETGHVIGLRLPRSCLFGSINSGSTLFRLRHLRTLDLSFNHFNYSEIPSSVAQVSKLTSLNLSYSVFSGQIPSELLALSELVFLDVSGNITLLGNPLLKLQKPGLRDLVQNLTHLKALYLTQVDISSAVPHELANLSSLTALDLGGCRLHGEFPRDIFRLPRLELLSVRYNGNLTGSLPEFEEGSSHPLQMLYLAGTSFSGELPTSIGRLSSLTVLDIRSCNFTGTIPHSLANLTALTQLILADNEYFSVGTLSWLGQQTKLAVLNLDHINLKGEIPSSLANMTQLTILSLVGNGLSGQIPSWLVNLTQLTQLLLDGNDLEGSIPSSLFELVNLQDLFLLSNHLNGTVELHLLSKLKNLTRLQLSWNRLSLLSDNATSNATFPQLEVLGLNDCNLTEFPDFLRNQDELKALFLSENGIHGSIPKWVWNVSRETLQLLDLSHNNLTGFEQPPAVLSWSSLHQLRLDSNELQGSLPIPPPSTFQYLVSENKLTGPIPPLICNMTSLEILDLSGNNLSGRIPPCLANFSKSLRVLDLGSNNFNGPIPETCRGPNILEAIDLGENQFQGQVPRSLANCSTLEHLVLGNNQINDIFPSWLGALPQLQVLIMRSNRFHGAIRRWDARFRFPKLRVIDLSENELMGDLPSDYFQNWDAMKVTEVSKTLRYMQANSTFKISGYEIIFIYNDSMRMTNKGVQGIYEEIPDTFTAIDFSRNNFRGRIPASIGNLKGLRFLNLSGNCLTGHIPSSLGNLTELESLDLSQNNLSGEIPSELTSMTFLGVFNVSHNDLTGAIPQGKQFQTFKRDSFDGNPGLCGTPLSRACKSATSDEVPPLPLSCFGQGFTSDLDWKFVLMGYGSGLVIGISMGYCFTSWQHDWFMKTFGERQR